MKQMRVGIGIDVHAFEQGRKLILAGVEIPYHQGLAGHSDADVLTHAIMDGMLGACALGSIGEYFPDNDPAFKDGNSLFFLREVMRLIANKGYSVVQLDSVVVKFLKKYEVYVEPPKNRNIADGALTGVVSAMAGPDVGGDMAIIQGQNKQTKIQQWTSWK